MTFDAPANGADSYTATFTASGETDKTFTGSSSPISATGLTPGQNYTVTVMATNTAGVGNPSSPSESITMGELIDSFIPCEFTSFVMVATSYCLRF